MSGTYSLRRRLLLGLLLALAVIAAAAIADSWREAQQTATQVSDRVLAGSILAIAERVIVAEDGSLEVDVPYVALEMLTSSAQDRVFYRVDGPAGFVTGYNALPTAQVEASEIVYDDRTFHGEPIRLGSLRRAASSGVSSMRPSSPAWPDGSPTWRGRTAIRSPSPRSVRSASRMASSG